MNKNNIYTKTLERFGKDAQVIMCFEEFAELQKELSKFLRGKGNFENTCEEIADVEIMIEQLKVLFNCQEKVNTYKILKLNRLQKVVECEKTNERN